MFLHKQAARKLLSKTRGPVGHYPAEVRSALGLVQASDDGEQEREQPAQEARPSGPPETSLRLAHGWFDWRGSSSWKATFQDAEQTVSLHRWTWLLLRLTERPSHEVREWGIRMMRDWVRTMEQPRSGLPWESYTTGERICNAVLFFAVVEGRRTGLPSIPADLQEALRRMARFLACRLEYHEPDATGNHVINNARALCFAGQAFGAAPYTQLAHAVLRHDLPRMVDSDGFLADGSSHYHFLVTRWLLELLWIGTETGDKQVCALVQPIATVMVERCWFFLVFDPRGVDWTIPLIGDVSPDFSWRWLADLPWSSSATKLFTPNPLPPPPQAGGWGSVFGNGLMPGGRVPRRESSEDPRVQSFRDGGWHRLDWGPLTVFWHIEPGGAPSRVSHGHCDIGSFCFYWDGVEILADPGRLNYREDDALGLYGVSARAHNGVLIDGIEPFVYWHRRRYPEAYRAGMVEASWARRKDEVVLSLRHTGFSRLCGDRIVYQRTFSVSRRRFVIEDRIDGHACHSLAFHFQWAPRVEVSRREQPGGFAVRSTANEFRGVFYEEPTASDGDHRELSGTAVRGRALPDFAGWYFPQYGERVESSSVVYECRARLPYARRFVLQWS